MQYPLTLHPTQKTVATDRHRYRVVNCGRRWGKTTLAALEITAKAVAKDGNDCCYIAPTYQQSRDLAWEPLKHYTRAAQINVNESRLEIIVKTQDKGTSKIVLKSWESIETLRGNKFAFIVADEISSYRNWHANWNEIVRPMLTDLKGEGLFISTPKGFNHFYDLYTLEAQNSDFKAFSFSSYDNPFIDPKELSAAKLELTEDQFAQEYMADFRKTEGLVYKEFDRKVHVFENAPEDMKEKVCGIDFGFTNPTALIEVYVDYDDTLWVMSEWYQRGKTNAEVIEYAKSYHVEAFYPDPAEPDRIEEMRRAGMNVREVNKDVQKGIDTVRNLLKNKRLRIHKSCINLINEFETYVYKEKRSNSNEPEEPVKENDHGLDALRYVALMKAEKRVFYEESVEFIPTSYL